MELGDLVRFRHCGRAVYVLADCLVGPRCPHCGEEVRFGLSDAPVRLRCPIENGHNTSCCFLVTSQLGPAGLSADNEAELHVGVSNSAGVVFSYSGSGVQRQQQGWTHCVVIPLVTPGNLDLHFMAQWDRELETYAAQDCWTPERFEEQRRFGSCCYGFALGFINQVMISEGKQPISSQDFTAQWVLPQTERMAKFLSLLELVRRRGYVSSNPNFSATESSDKSVTSLPPAAQKRDPHPLDL
ncbi:MKRN2 opposite strand, tandem duplicate 1 [Neosynchiropus ocellatus]